MSEPKRPLKVFLCHAHADRDAVRALYNRLVKDGVDTWLDKEKLLPGQDWELEIRKAVRESDVVVVCLSKQFNQAGFRQKEVRLALDTAMEKPEGEIFIIPARLEECESLESLKKWHWVDLFEDDGYETLLWALRARADKIGATLQPKKFVVSKSKSPFLTKPEVMGTNKKTEVANITKRRTEDLGYKQRSRKLILFGLIFVSLVALSVWIWLKTSTFVTLPTEIADTKDVQMVLVPAGEFIMGNNLDSYHPLRTVAEKDFYIDKYEVTNALYKKCVEAFVCMPPIKDSSYSRPDYYGNSDFDNYPVIYVNWDMANTYCGWRQARLPSNDEWEKAARGTDGRTYPWGENADCKYANYAIWNGHNGFNYCVGDTSPVNSYDSGRSPYGVYNLSGNVQEWTSDSDSVSGFHPGFTPYPITPVPNSLTFHFIRGGRWDTSLEESSWVSLTYSTMADFVSGFRCAKDANAWWWSQSK